MAEEIEVCPLVIKQTNKTLASHWDCHENAFISIKAAFPLIPSCWLRPKKKKDLCYPNPISFWLSETCRKVGERTSHFHIISLQVFKIGRSMAAVLSNWQQCAHPVCSYCQCCWWTWHSDLLAICPYPDGRNRMPWVSSLISQQQHPQTARIHTQPMAIVKCFVPCCENALVAL